MTEEKPSEILQFKIEVLTGEIKERIRRQLGIIKSSSRGRSRSVKTEKIQYYRVYMEKDAPILEFNMSAVNSLETLIKELKYNFHDLSDVKKIEIILRTIRCGGLKPEKVITTDDVTKEFKETLERLRKEKKA